MLSLLETIADALASLEKETVASRRAFLGLGLAGALGCAAGCASVRAKIAQVPILGLNLREVDNYFYRSSQVNEGDLIDLKNNYGIETVLILRGEHSEEEWYSEEIKACEKLGIETQAFAFSSKYPSAPDIYLSYITALEQNQHNVKLVHCKSGSERAALAAAFYILATGGNLSDAKEELDSIHSAVSRHSYMRKLINNIWEYVKERDDRTTAMKEFFSSLEYIKFYEELNPDVKLVLLR